MSEEGNEPTTELSVGDAVKAVVTSKSYYNGVVHAVAVPILEAIVKATDNVWDNTLLSGAVSLIDMILPKSES